MNLQNNKIWNHTSKNSSTSNILPRYCRWMMRIMRMRAGDCKKAKILKSVSIGQWPCAKPFTIQASYLSKEALWVVIKCVLQALSRMEISLWLIMTPMALLVTIYIYSFNPWVLPDPYRIWDLCRPCLLQILRKWSQTSTSLWTCTPRKSNSWRLNSSKFKLGSQTNKCNWAIWYRRRTPKIKHWNN